MNVKDIKAIVTGGTSGIGLATAMALKNEGAEVIICARSQEGLDVVKSEHNLMGIQADVSDEAQIRHLFQSSKNKLGNYNVLINNAGIGSFFPLTETTAQDFQRIWEVNTKGLFLAGREAAKHFIDQQYGNIVNVGSTAALKGYPTGSSYVASKFAVTGLTECWRAELRKYNIRVMQVNPSEVQTDFAIRAGRKAPEPHAFKLKSEEIAHVIVSMLKMRDIGFVPSASIWATNPWRE